MGAPVHDGPLRIAIATSRDPLVVLPRLSALCSALSEVLGRRASGHLMVSYDELEQGAQENAFHLMWLPPLVALSLVPRGLATAMAVPVRKGRTTYSTAIFTRPDSDITALEDLKGRSVGWVDERSSAGYVLPRALLASRSLPPDDLFSDEHFLGGHQRVVKAVLDGRVAAGATFARIDGGKIADAAWGEREVRVLASYGPIPGDMVAIGRALDRDLEKQLDEHLYDPDSTFAKQMCALLECETVTAPEPRHLDALRALAEPA